MSRVSILKKPFSTVSAYLVLVLFSFVILVPLVWLIPTAFKNQADLFANPTSLLPQTINVSNFITAWNYVPFGKYYVNTIIIVFGLLIVQLATSILASYAFSRLSFPGRDILFIIFIVQLMITPQATILPNYLTIRYLGILDTKLAVMLPYCGSAFGIFLLRQAMKVIPREMEDVATVDGCTKLQFLSKIVVPLVKPAIITFSLASISYHWNEFLWPLIITDTARARPLTVGLTIFAKQAEGGAEWTLLMAATLMVMLPVLIVFLIFQRKFVEVHMRSGLK